MRVLQISGDRSKRGVLYPDTSTFKRQEAYAEAFGNLDIIGFSRKGDGAREYKDEHLHIVPTNSSSRHLYGIGAYRIARKLQKPDVVSVQDPFETGLVGWWLARKFKVPLHVQIHTDFLSPAYQAQTFANRIRVRIARFVLSRADAIRVVSQRISNSLKAGSWQLKATPVILPIFVDVESVRTGLKDYALEERYSVFKYRLLVVARLEREKNVELAIRAFKKTAPNGSCLIIVGEGSETARLQKLAKVPGGNSHIFFEGSREPAMYYSIADLVLVPSNYEGYGMVIVEALASGKPVLATDVGVAHEAGAIVTSEEKFADALRAWFENGPRSAELKGYPYDNFDEYVRAYCDNIRACVGS